MARPIIDAIRAGDVSLAKKLLTTQKYCSLDCQSSVRDGTALYWAACRGLLEIVELLLVHGAAIGAKTGYGSTPLHAAADCNKTKVISLLLKYEADVNAPNASGDTPCHLAAYRGHNHAVQLLVEGGADLSLRNRKRHRPIDEAECNGHSNIVEYITAVSDIFNCTEPIQEIELSLNLPRQRVPLKDCNSSPVKQAEGQASHLKNNHFRLYHHQSINSDLSPVCPVTENNYMSSFRTVNDLSLTTQSATSNPQMNYFNIPLYE